MSRSSAPPGSGPLSAAADTEVMSRVWGGTLAACLVLCASLAGLGGWHRFTSSSPALAAISGADCAPRGDSAGRGSPSPGEQLIEAVLRRQAHAVQRKDRAAYLSTWDTCLPRTRRAAFTTYHNLMALSVSGLRLSARGSHSSRVRVTWSIRDFSPHPAHGLVNFRFVQRDSQVKVAAVRSIAGEPAPMWISGELTVRRAGQTLVAASSAAVAEELLAEFTSGRNAVTEVLGPWHRGLVVVAPASIKAVEEILGKTRADVQRIAAVTTTLTDSRDAATGGRDASMPRLIVWNPLWRTQLSGVGGQFVTNHELTHAVLGHLEQPLPVWLVEGLADYVALKSTGVAGETVAGPALREVRLHGLPRGFPTDEQFEPSSRRLAARYAQAFLVNQLIAETFGEAALLDFYQAASRRRGNVSKAMRLHLDISAEQLTQRWRRYVARMTDE
ncbi:MAG: hypothetical protein ACR2GB_01725 [Nocardioidaceae bacterium]